MLFELIVTFTNYITDTTDGDTGRTAKKKIRGLQITTQGGALVEDIGNLVAKHHTLRPSQILLLSEGIRMGGLDAFSILPH